eukprot:jgi/Psemu1/238219/estExt_Genewise1.C_930034
MTNLLIFALFASASRAGTAAFVPSSINIRDGTVALGVGYVPDGMTPEQWQKLKNSERKNQSKKNLGAYGITRGFKSRSLQSFQTELERGKASHLMPMYNAKEKLKSGRIKTDDIPYMQRSGGSWDGADVGKKKKWSAVDKNYKQSAIPVARPDYNLGTVQRRADDVAASKPRPQSKKLFGLF